MRTKRWIALAVTASLVLTACGTDDDAETAAPDDTDTTDTTDR
jgi:major membrane immunogen (membrane-anchored lipoprotein)